MNTINLVHGVVAGVGRSTFALLLTDWMLVRGFEPTLLLADPERTALGETFAPYCRVEEVDLRTGDGWADLIEIAASDDESPLVVHVPPAVAGTLTKLGGWLRENARAIDRRVLCWFAFRPDINEPALREMVDGYAAGFDDLILVRNLVTRRGWRDFQASETRKRFMAHPSAHETMLEPIWSWAARRIFDAVPPVRPSAAIAHGGDPARLGFAGKIAASHAIDLAYADLDAVANRIGLGNTQASCKESA
jgi:hypothetical protein